MASASSISEVHPDIALALSSSRHCGKFSGTFCLLWSPSSCNLSITNVTSNLLYYTSSEGHTDSHSVSIVSGRVAMDENELKMGLLFALVDHGQLRNACERERIEKRMLK